MRLSVSRFLLLYTFAVAAYAVEVTPDIGFKQYHAPNGAQYAPNSAYRTPIEGNHAYAMNDGIFGGHSIANSLPDINSVGLNFKFDVD